MQEKLENNLLFFNFFRYEEETRKANELQRQLEKKRKKKESQRLKKLAAKGKY